MTEAEKTIARFAEADVMARRLGLGTLVEDATTRALYLDSYADTVSRAMYGGRRPNGIWNLERAAKLLRDQSSLIAAYQCRVAELSGQQ